MPDCNGFTAVKMPKTKHQKVSKLFSAKKPCLSPTTVTVTATAATVKTYSPAVQTRRKKSVSFNEQKLEEVIEFEDDQDSKNARKLYWEFMAVDRFRFKDRVQRMEPLLSPILAAAHRNGIYSGRMQNLELPSSSLLSAMMTMGPSSRSICDKHKLEMEIEVEVESIVEKFVIGSSLQEASVA